jgi:RHS repeat-associated protein
VNFGSFTRTVGLSYAPNGRLAGITYPDGASVVYRYDGAGRLNELEHPGGLMRYSAYQWQRATRVELPGDLVRREAFDALQRTTKIEVGPTPNPTAVMNHRYTYDVVGNITQKATLAGPTAYAYDALDRLTQATPPASTGLPSEAYTYDAVHNRQSSAHQPGPWSYNGNHELTQWGEGANATSLEYDANGNLVRETRGSTTRTFVYDLFDRLIEVRDNAQPIARYAWDPFARRVKKEVITGATSTTTWMLSIQRGVLAEYDANGTLQADWQWEPDAPWSTGPVAQRTRDGQTLRSHQIHIDHLWTPVALTDAQGTVAWRAQHEAFGSPIIEAGATATTPWRFPGQYADAETGLSWNLWRHYDPRTGRYTQSDPMGLTAGPNFFAYTSNSPINRYDASGTMWTPSRSPYLPTSNPINSVGCNGPRPTTITDRANNVPHCPGIKACIEEHEMVHLNDATASGNPCSKVPVGELRLLHPPTWPEFFASEERAHSAEINCLLRYLNEFLCDPICTRVYRARLKQMSDSVECVRFRLYPFNCPAVIDIEKPIDGIPYYPNIVASPEF